MRFFFISNEVSDNIQHITSLLINPRNIELRKVVSNIFWILQYALTKFHFMRRWDYNSCFKIKYIPTWFFCIACRAAGCFSDKDSSILLNHKSWHFGSTRFSSQFFRKPQSEKSRWNYNSSKISIRILVRKTAIISNLIKSNNLQYNMLVR
jgi:hypothetical protein